MLASFKMDTDEYVLAKPVFISALIIANIILNSTVILVIVKYPQLREDRTTFFMFSLTLSDLATGCTMMPISAAVCSRATPQVRTMLPYLPMIHQMCSSWFGFVSLHSLCWVAVSKMVAITRPLRYEQLLTRRRCLFIIAMTWFIGAFFAISLSYMATQWEFTSCCYKIYYVSLSGWETALLAVHILISWVFPVITIIYATASMLTAIFRAHIQINAQINSIAGLGSAVGNPQSLTLHSMRSGKNVLVICFVLLILTLPVVIPMIVIVIGKGNDVPCWYKFLATWVYMCNYSANSLIYLTIFRSVRKKTYHMFSELCGKCYVGIQ